MKNAPLNVRLFALPSGISSETTGIRTYVSAHTSPKLRSATRVSLFPLTLGMRIRHSLFVRGYLNGAGPVEERWLAKIIRQWRPSIIQTLGLDPAGLFYARVRQRFELAGIGRWVLQLRGGSDLTLSHCDPQMVEKLAPVVRSCDQLLSDNRVNIRYLLEMGVKDEQIAPIVPVPGTGGVDLQALQQFWQGQPAIRRLILWPKAYECPWSKVLPVYEALKMAWNRIQPCELSLLAMNAEARRWWWTLPESIRRACRTHERIPHSDVLRLMGRARVMLAPSLVDGLPNTLLEAMVAGVFPIVSPLETITPIVKHETNVLFARNLYPQEIADALVRAMRDDNLVSSAAQSNLDLAGRIADRGKIQPRVIEYYEALAKS